MGKRISSRRSSLSDASPMDDDDDRAVDTLKPPKRLKTVDGSAVASPGSTAARRHEVEDETMIDEPVASTVTKKETKPNQRKSRPSTHVDAEGDAAELADPDATVLHSGGGGAAATATNGAGDAHRDAMSDISEDTDGDVPIPKKRSTSSYLRLADLDINNNEPQVTVCAWDGCKADDLGTMDKLVEHLHAEHVEGKQRRYTCEWIGCPRKGKSHASAYALKAHLRSHTRERPHVCLLPECDQAFARQDALNKHMRSTHDIDFVRSLEASSRGFGGGRGGAGAAANGTAGTASGSSIVVTNGKGGSSKLKIIMKTPQSHAAGHGDAIDHHSGGSDSSLVFVNMAGSETTVLSKDQGFTLREMEMEPKKLYGLCRSQLRWAEDEGDNLRKECAAWEEVYNKAWLEQQVLLDQVIESEKNWYERRKLVLADEEKQRAAAAAAKAAEEAAEAAARGDDAKDEDDSAAEDDNDNDGDGDEDDDDDMPSLALDPDATRDDYSFADTTAFSARGGSSLRNEVTVNGD